MNLRKNIETRSARGALLLSALAATLCAFVLVGSRAASADESNDTGSPDARWTVHGQSTIVSQEHGEFPSPYEGPNSLQDRKEVRSSVTGTLFLGIKLLPGTELYYNPEIAMGRGLSNVTGVAGFPNGEISRVSSANPTLYNARLFVRQTIGLGGATKEIKDDVNQIAQLADENRLVFTAGKLSALDIFDSNQYSHDPRAQFLNWALMANGAWDFPADARGYSDGATVEWIHPDWALRAGVFLMPVLANGLALDSRLSKAHGAVAEYERDFQFRGHPGVIRLMYDLNRAHMGSYSESDALSALAPDITATREIRSKSGWGVNVEQELTDTLGGFLRLGRNDGRTETFAFTEIDRTISAGLSLKGSAWQRSNDLLGVAFVSNGLSSDHRQYLALGGDGIILGDGGLNYGSENILESYYALKVPYGGTVSIDAQRIIHPGYNRDRGPVTVLSTRLHAEF